MLVATSSQLFTVPNAGSMREQLTGSGKTDSSLEKGDVDTHTDVEERWWEAAHDEIRRGDYSITSCTFS